MTALEASSAVNSNSSQTKGSQDFVGELVAWITTTDHKRIGRLFLRGGFVWLISVIGVGAALGVERIDSDRKSVV